MEPGRRARTLVATASRGDLVRARELALAALSEPDLATADAAITLAGLAFTEYLATNFTTARARAELSLEIATASGDNEALLHALSVCMLASAGATRGADDPARDYFALAWELRTHAVEHESRWTSFHLLAEGAVATGRLTEAQHVLDELGHARGRRTAEDEAAEPFPLFVMIQRARVHLFLGEMAEACTVLEPVIAEAAERQQSAVGLLAEALHALALAHLGDRATTRQFATRLHHELPSPKNLIETGAWVVCAYALQVVGDRDRAAECVLIAGLGSELLGLQLLDRALGYDILVGAALARGDIDAASAWGSRSLPLAAHPPSAVVVEETLARLDEARGDTQSAAERARVAAARSRLTGRYLDAARADLLEARAMAASGHSGAAVKRLTDLAHDADRVGVLSVADSARRELRALGRRLEPARGSRWSTLSEREREIALLAAEGFSNRVIGQSLFLSERTVQTYMSRILIAFAVESRSALPHQLGLEAQDPADWGPRAELTHRQQDVARLVSEGLTNREIAASLGISVKTVEKHLAEIFVRWGLDSRTGVARAVLATRDERR